MNFITKYRSFVSQCCATAALSLLLVAHGAHLGFPTILIPELQHSAEINVTMADISWISSIICLSLPLGNAPSGIYVDYFGRRFGVMITAIPMFFGWLVLHFAKDLLVIFFMLILLSVTGGVTEGPVFMYVTEISETRFRSVLLSSAATATITGMFFLILLGKFVYWRTLALINAIFSIISFVIILWIPESPYWLASKGKFDKAKDSLNWLRGWTTDSNVTEEFCILSDAFPSSQSFEEDVKCRSNVTCNLRNYVKPFFKRSFYLPFMLTTFVFFIHALNGNVTVLAFSIIIFEHMDTPINTFTVSAIMGLFNLIGTILCIIFISWLGKRKICFITTIGTSICYLMAAIYLWVCNQGHVADKNLTWIPIIMLLLAILFSAGFNAVPWVLIGEVFPASLRSIGSALVITIFYVFSWAINMAYLYLVKKIEYSGSFLLFCIVNFLGCIGLLITLPETEGKSLEEIQEYFSCDSNTKESLNKTKPKHVLNVYFTQNKTT